MWFRKMMENLGTHNLIEARLQLVHSLDGKLVDLEIVQVVFSIELLSTAYARCAEVDADYLSRRPPQGMLSRLRCPVAGNENGVVFPVRSVRPKQMIIRAASLSVLPDPLILFKALDRPKIRVTFAEVSDFPSSMNSHYYR